MILLPQFNREWKEKYDVKDDEVQDTLSFNLRNTFIFRHDLTAPLTGSEMITMPHMVLMVKYMTWILVSQIILNKNFQRLDQSVHTKTDLR